MNSAVPALQSSRVSLAAKKMPLAVLLVPAAEKMRDIAWQDRLRPSGRPRQTGIGGRRVEHPDPMHGDCIGRPFAGN